MASSSGSSVEQVDRHVLRKYEIVQKLGKGAYAVVFKAVDKKTKQVVALKKIFDAFQNKTDAQRTFREIKYLLALKTPKEHANIITLQNFMKAENDKDIYLVFDFMETDLHAVIRANILQPVHKQFIVYQSLKALKFCHSGNLLHRDLKPSNMLLNEECCLKLADFGLARSVKGAKDAADNGALTDYVATRWYRAPEILLGSTSYTKAVDMWAIGCIVAEMFIGRPLLQGKSTIDQLQESLLLTGLPSDETLANPAKMGCGRFGPDLIGKLKASGTQFSPASEDHRRAAVTKRMPGVDPGIIDFVVKALDIDPTARISVDLPESERNGTKDALAHPWLKPFVKENEWELDRWELCADDSLNIDDDEKREVAEYRNQLYQHLRDLRKDSVARMGNFGAVRGAARMRAGKGH